MHNASPKRPYGRHARSPGRTFTAAVVALIAALFVAACGSSSSSSTTTSATSAAAGSATTSSTSAASGGGSLTLGTKDFTEEFILGQLYKQALEAKGYKVNYKENIGATEIIDKALTSKKIDAYPEYTGVSLSVVAGNNKLTKSPEETASLVKAFYEKRGQMVSDTTTESGRGIAVRFFSPGAKCGLPISSSNSQRNRTLIGKPCSMAYRAPNKADSAGPLSSVAPRP